MDDTCDSSSLDDRNLRDSLQQMLISLSHERRLKTAEKLLLRYPQQLQNHKLLIQQELITLGTYIDEALQALQDNNLELAAEHLNNACEYCSDLDWDDPQLQPLRILMPAGTRLASPRIPRPVLLTLALITATLLLWTISLVRQPTVEQTFDSLTAAVDACDSPLAHQQLVIIQQQAVSSKQLWQRLADNGRKRAQQAFKMQRNAERATTSPVLLLRQAELFFDLAVTAGDYVQRLERGIVRTELGLLLRTQQPAESTQLLRLAVKDFQKLLQEPRISSPELPENSLSMQLRDACRSRLLRLQRLAPECFTH